MSKSEVPPDSWDMDTNDTSQQGTPEGDMSALSSNFTALNVNAPAFVPNVNAAAFVPSNYTSVPPPNEQTLPSAAVPGGNSAPVVSLDTATSIQNGNHRMLGFNAYFLSLSLCRIAALRQIYLTLFTILQMFHTRTIVIHH